MVDGCHKLAGFFTAIDHHYGSDHFIDTGHWPAVGSPGGVNCGAPFHRAECAGEGSYPAPASGRGPGACALPRSPDFSFSKRARHVLYRFLRFHHIPGLALMKPSIRRTLLVVVFGLLVLLIGVSRVYVGEHWASDALGAYLLGALTLVAIIELYRWGKPRFFVHQPVAKAESEGIKRRKCHVQKR